MTEPTAARTKKKVEINSDT